MIIEFKYKISDDIFALANKELVNFYDNYITGYLDEGDVHHLQHCSLYMVCEIIDPNKKIYGNAVAVVASNESRALEIYGERIPNKNAIIFYQILDNCKNIKVIPT